MRFICSPLSCIALALLFAGSLPIARAAERTQPSIFKCELDGVATFSDRPCGVDAQMHTPDPTALNTYEAPPISPRRSSPSSPPRKPADSREDRSAAVRAQSCARYSAELKEIRAKMRSGYTAKEGERLRQRADKLRDSQRSARCS